jgi:hypothetical protein
VTDTPSNGGIDRRSLLKKSAAAGALVWAAPAVTNMSVAHATSTPGDGRFTNCVPEVLYTLLQTGADCGAYNDNPDTTVDLDPNCCNEWTYVLTTSAGCGDTCAGGFADGTSSDIVEIVAGQGEIGPKPGCSDPQGLVFYSAQNCQQAAEVTLLIRSFVTCEDGITYLVEDEVLFDVTNCPLEAPGTVVVPGEPVPQP